MGKYDISEDLKYAMLSYDLKGVSTFYFFTLFELIIPKQF